MKQTPYETDTYNEGNNHNNSYIDEVDEKISYMEQTINPSLIFNDSNHTPMHRYLNNLLYNRESHYKLLG